ncbi:YciI family protein [Sneathiella sp.]|uniref:YciI family protein n=1 Tax=Sneathiella sp. TaxID=1964365 RepID=UPI00356A7A56
MLFIAFCTDKLDHLQVRLNNRPDHLAFLKAKGNAIKIAGPTTDSDGKTPNGSLLIFEDEDLEAAEAWIANDPYGQAGLFESVVVKPWRHAIGDGL